MNIQWFPGHMTRAKREIEQKLKQIDMVIELLDARIPLASRNPMIDELVKTKPRLILLNKSDLADPECTELWISYFRERTDTVAIGVDSTSSRAAETIAAKCKDILAAKRESQRKKGLNPRSMRVLIVGIPNVGKSTLINRMANRYVAKTGDRPGITKGQQWIKVAGDMELLDTPGILWPKFDNQLVGIRLAATGAIREEILALEDIAYHAIRYLLYYYPDRVRDRFELDEVPNPEQSAEVVELMETIGRRRGCLRSGGVIDLEKASAIVLKEMRSGKFGRISLERPQDHDQFDPLA